MKNNQLILMLVFVLLISAAFNCWLIITYRVQLHRVRDVNTQMISAQGLAESLMKDLNEYSKRNPAITSVLQNLPSRASAPAATSR
jgi:hypothetical protein